MNERDQLTGLPLVPADEDSKAASSARAAQARAMREGLPPDQRQGVNPRRPPADCPRCHGRQGECPLGERNWRLCPHAR